MNVCMIASGYPSQSKPLRDIFIHEQAKEMVKQGLKVHVIAPEIPGDDVSPREGIFEGVCVHRVINLSFKPARLFPLAFAVKAARKAVQLNKGEKFDVIHAQFADHAGFAGAITAKILRRPLLITVHGYDIYYSKELGYGLGTTWLQRIYVFLVLKSANRILPVSTAAERQCITRWHVNPRKLEVIHNGINIQKLPSPAKLDRFKSDLNIDGKKVILSISSLLKRKGQQHIIRALPAVIKRVPEAIFILVGQGSYLPELERLIQELGLEDHVRMTRSFVASSEIQMFLNICHVFVLVSVLESFGIVYLEALSQGRPVIGTRGEGDGDFIVDGENGFLVDPDNTEELAQRIVAVLENYSLRESMGRQGKKMVVEEYLWKHNVGKVVGAYRELIRR